MGWREERSLTGVRQASLSAVAQGVGRRLAVQWSVEREDSSARLQSSSFLCSDLSVGMCQGVRAAGNIESLVFGRPLEAYHAHHADIR